MRSTPVRLTIFSLSMKKYLCQPTLFDPNNHSTNQNDAIRQCVYIEQIWYTFSANLSRAGQAGPEWDFILVQDSLVSPINCPAWNGSIHSSTGFVVASIRKRSQPSNAMPSSTTWGNSCPIRILIWNFRHIWLASLTTPFPPGSITLLSPKSSIDSISTTWSNPMKPERNESCRSISPTRVLFNRLPVGVMACINFFKSNTDWKWRSWPWPRTISPILFFSRATARTSLVSPAPLARKLRKIFCIVSIRSIRSSFHCSTKTTHWIEDHVDWEWRR